MAGVRKGGVNNYTVQESNNTGLGQGGSLFIDTADQDITAPDNHVFVAITIVAAAAFNDLVSTEPDKYMGTTGTASTSGPPGYLIDNSNTFPGGVTIFGRCNKIDINSGSVIAYIGK